MNEPYATGCSQICNQGRDCTCVVQPCQAANEAGNVWYAEPEEVPLTWYEIIVICGGIWVICCAAIIIIFVALGYAHVRFFQ